MESWSVANLGDGDSRVRIMGIAIKPIDPSSRMQAPAFTVLCGAGDNLAIHHAVAAAPTGCALVIHMPGEEAFGCFGEILALNCIRNGLKGAIIDGYARDADDLVGLGFPIFCRGFSARQTAKKWSGALNVAIPCGGVHVEPGDIVVGDRDGVAVAPAAAWPDMAAAIERVQTKERHLKARIEAGANTLDVI